MDQTVSMANRERNSDERNQPGLDVKVHDLAEAELVMRENQLDGDVLE